MTSPALDRFVGRPPVIGPSLPDFHDSPPFPVTISRMPENERRLPDPKLMAVAGVQWEHVAAGALAGFGAGFAWALALVVLAP
ncbi:MAG: hypothetical protein O3A10_09210 [Chloroflexi bacterium]|nr:hypothetical protein [Chloroflexota bacterium]MDA1146633.1 hypothetical protein [Chloroflexota bacterium]